MNNWIEVNKQKPDEDTFVLVLVHVVIYGEQQVWPNPAFYHRDKFYLSQSPLDKNMSLVTGDFDISHWISIPCWLNLTPPKKRFYNRLSEIFSKSGGLKKYLEVADKYKDALQND